MIGQRNNLATFAPATQELLNTNSLLSRFDFKYVLSECDLQQVLKSFERDYAIITTGDLRVFKYQNLYYDTSDKLCFHDHRRGRFPRYKVRIRHYCDRKLSFLELKTKGSNLISNKQRMAQSFMTSNLDSNADEFIKQGGFLPGKKLAPAIRTEFERVSFVNKKQQERITIDFNLCVRNAEEDRERKINGAAIVEVKQFKINERSAALLALRAAGIRRRSISKYCIGSMLLDEQLRGNRFLPELKFIQGF